MQPFVTFSTFLHLSDQNINGIIESICKIRMEAANFHVFTLIYLVNADTVLKILAKNYDFFWSFLQLGGN
jgi:hypothetical protein